MTRQDRDQWGETADERYRRIEMRTNALMRYQDERAADGVPIEPHDRLAFNAGYAAGRLDYLDAGTSASGRCIMSDGELLDALVDAIDNIDEPGSDAYYWTAEAKRLARALHDRRSSGSGSAS